LPWKNVDTGMGFERLVTVVQGKQTPYETDLFQPVIESVARLAGVRYGQDERVTRSLRIIADHSRSIAFITAEGVMPSAEGRGYVLRRLIRRAALHGRLLGIQRPFLTEPLQAVIDGLGSYWSELVDRRAHILGTTDAEERRFLRNLERGLGIFDEIAERAAGEGSVISGEEAFLLHDTYGFPLELTQELGGERGLSVDVPGFEGALKQQRTRAQERQAFRHDIGTPREAYLRVADEVEPTIFTGHDALATLSEVVAILANGVPVPRAEQGDEVEIVLAATPFYAEAGGQVGDTGVIRGDAGEARVLDTQRPVASLIVHKAEIVSGAIAVGDAAEAEVDAERRLHILPHHSGTHLLHKALQEVLGPEATQAGSLVAPDHLRFDFQWPRPLTEDELREVQDRVNAAVMANLPVRKEIKPYEQAIREGAMALFGEKYGDRVRVVSMGDWSKELCGGTHVNATGDIGLFLITAETGIGSGVRRIEALAGAAAYAYANELRDEVTAAAAALETRPENLVARGRQVMTQLRDAEKRIEALTQQLAAREAEALLRQSTSIDGMTVVAEQVRADSKEYVEATADAVKSRLDKGVVVLGSVVGGSPFFTMAVTRNLSQAGVQANEILRRAAREAQGGAGGSAEFAQGGGRDASKVQDVLNAAVDLIRERAAH
jgi:alanyl-tRNA synthetase